MAMDVNPNLTPVDSRKAQRAPLKSTATAEPSQTVAAKVAKEEEAATVALSRGERTPTPSDPASRIRDARSADEVVASARTQMLQTGISPLNSGSMNPQMMLDLLRA